ncbi:RDD family protein [uncultured Cohaesibacter sp.]|uniref:RDD family protein n=1 Tax=uncultured Cohaesibacter sp. TaxID=1002546 RepID=UPI00292CBA42|nr:RDD family protein [uncultured Cohaesibacter sp.]
MIDSKATYHGSSERENVFDPRLHPALFDGVLSRRILAFLFDAVLIFCLMILVSIVIAILGAITFGLGWLLYAALFPLVTLSYTAVTLGGYNAATPGMRFMGLEMRLWYGARPYGILAVMHSLLFWFGNVILTPFILLVGLFTSRKQLLHDMLLGTVVMDRDALMSLEGQSRY